MNDLYTGALIYNNYNFEPLLLEQEISGFRFFPTATRYWIAASCSDGRVVFISRPQTSQGRNFLKFKRVRGSHKRDVITLDINSEANPQLVTGSADNKISFWNCYTGNESKTIQIPEEIVGSR